MTNSHCEPQRRSERQRRVGVGSYGVKKRKYHRCQEKRAHHSPAATNCPLLPASNDRLSTLPLEILEQIVYWCLLNAIGSRWKHHSPFYTSPRSEFFFYREALVFHTYQMRSLDSLGPGSTKRPDVYGLLATTKYLNCICNNVLWRNFPVSFEWQSLASGP